MTHDERQSRRSNDVELDVVEAIVRANPATTISSIAVVSPHRAQRSALQLRLADLTGKDKPIKVIDTVERLQGGEASTIIVSATALSAGTAVGGWRIMRTMGHRVAELEPVHGFAAETTAATVLVGTAHFGMPVSTTHVISSAILGVGTSQGLRAVRWGVARNILVAWVLTIPAAGIMAAAAWLLIDALGLVN